MADEIGRAMQKVGGTAGALNVNFEKVSSWIAVISSRTRESAETIGQSVKSILARMQSMKEQGFDQEDGTKVNAVAKALASINVNLMDSNGQFRNFGTVMDEIGAKWQNLDSRTKSYIATTVAGTYQQSRFLNLMEGYKDSTDLYAKSLDSAGTASKKFQLYQQGTQAQLDKLKSSMESVWMGLFNSKGIQTIITSLTGLIKTIKSITDIFGGLAPVLAIAGTAILAFNGGLKSIMTNGTLTIATLKSLATQGVGSIDAAFTAATLKARLFSAATSGMSLAVGGLKKAFLATGTFLAGSLFPMAAFAAVGFAIQKITEYFQQQAEEAAKLKKQEDETVKSYSAHADKIDELAAKYEALNQKVKEGKLSSTDKEYVDTMNSLGKIYPVLVEKESEHGDKILRSVDAVKEELNYAKQLKDNYDKMTITNFNDDLDVQAKKVDDILSKIDSLKSDKAGGNAPVIQQAKGVVNVSDSQKISDNRGIIEQEHELQLALYQSKDFINEKAQAFMDMDGVTNKLSATSKKLIQSYIDEAIASKKTVKDGNDLKNFLSDTTNNAEELGKKLAKIPKQLQGLFSLKDIKGLSKDQLNVLSVDDPLKSGYANLEQYKEALEKVGISGTLLDEIIKKFTKTVKNNNGAVSDNKDLTKQWADAVAKASKAYDDSISKLKDYHTVLDDLRKSNKLSADTIQMLADKYPELLGYIGNEKLLHEKVQEAIESEKKVAIDAMNEKLSTSESYFSQVYAANKGFFDGLAKLYGVDLKNSNTLAELKAKIEAKLIDSLGSKWADYYDAQAMAFTAAGKAMLQGMGYEEAIHSPQLKAIAEYEAAMKKLSATLKSFTANSSFSSGITGLDSPTGSGSNSKKPSGSGSSSSADDKFNKLVASKTKPFEDNIAKDDQDIKASQTLMARYVAGSKEWLAEVNKQIALQKDKISQTDKEIAALQKLLKTEKLTKDQRAQINSQIKDLINNQLEYVNAIADEDKQVRESAINAKIQSTTDLYNEQIAALQKKLDLLNQEEKVQSRLQEMQAIQNQIDKAKSDTSHQYIDKNGNVQYTYDKSAVADLEQQQKDKLNQYAQEDKVAGLEQQIATAEKNRDDAIAKLQKLQEDYNNKTYKNTADLTKIMGQFVKDLDKIYKTGIIPLPKHHDGGIVGVGSSSSKLTSLVNNLFNVKPNEEVVKALKGEVMIPASNIPNFLTNMQNFTKGLGSNIQSTVKNYNISNLTIKSDNPQDFFTQLDVLIRSQ